MKRIKEFWGKLKYWQKGGLIAFLIWIFHHIIYFFGCRNDLGCFVIFLPEIPLILFFDNLIGYEVNFNVIFVLSIFFWFLVGALIGLIIGKLKKK